MDEIPHIDETSSPPRHGPTTRYVPVRVDKFIVLCIVTFGLYEIVWFYRNWKDIKQAEQVNLWAWARAVFAPLFYYAFLKRLGIAGAVGLTVAYLFITAAWRLPDPYWMLAILSFLVILPAVQAVNRLNAGVDEYPPSYNWRTRDAVFGFIGLALVLLAGLGTLGPSTAVVAGDALSADDLAFLRSAGVLGEDEQPIFFYSPGFLSIKGEGVVASDWGVTSYWIDPVSEAIDVAFLAYAEIQGIETNPSSSWAEDTVVRINGTNGSWFVFVLSAEDGGDVRFLDEVERRRSTASKRRFSA